MVIQINKYTLELWLGNVVLGEFLRSVVVKLAIDSTLVYNYPVALVTLQSWDDVDERVYSANINYSQLQVTNKILQYPTHSSLEFLEDVPTCISRPETGIHLP